LTLRIGIGGIWHETNTFAPGRTELADFEAHGIFEGPGAIWEAFGGTGTEVGGTLDACAALGLEPVPFFWAGAVPGPTVSAEARAMLWRRFLAGLAETVRLDGVVLALHGAMVAEDVEDPESDLIARVRDLVGSIPVAVVLDLHGNPGSGLIEAADLVLAYETYPHTDAAERAKEATRLLAAMLEGDLAPLVTGRRLPLLTCPLAQATAEQPMADLLALARRAERQPGVVAVSLLPGYPYADVERLGFAVVVSGENGAANAAADELAATAWARAGDFRPALVPVDEGVERALASQTATVVADVSDNVGGGAPGNGTHVLRALLEAGARGAVGVLHDPEAAAGAATAGVGAEVELEAGSPPLRLRGRVAHAGQVRYRRSGSYMTGLAVDMGLCAVVEADGVEVVLTSQRVMPFDSDHLRAVGIEPAKRRILVVKSAIAWRAAFEDVSAEALYVDTPGVCTCRLETLPYRRVRRPIVPLDSLPQPGLPRGSTPPG
jgi:microcystin degradation protein MlrC